jgi:hypothetical protein
MVRTGDGPVVEGVAQTLLAVQAQAESLCHVDDGGVRLP